MNCKYCRLDSCPTLCELLVEQLGEDRFKQWLRGAYQNIFGENSPQAIEGRRRWLKHLYDNGFL